MSPNRTVLLSALGSRGLRSQSIAADNQRVRLKEYLDQFNTREKEKAVSCSLAFQYELKNGIL